MLQISTQALASLLAEAYESGVIDGANGSARPLDEIWLEYEEKCDGLASDDTRH